MIHIITVHWNNPNWIKIQNDYIKRYFKTDYKIVSCLTGIDSSYDKYFDEVTHTGLESHSEKLDLMANTIAESSDLNDIFLFLDGDAFPISENVQSYIRKLKDYPLIAIQRLENSGDIQPHPSFCMTTVEFWKKHRLTWKAGYEWGNENGLTTDVGAEILNVLEINKIDWLKINRSKSLVQSQRLWFGVYGGSIYHHGAGFRDSISRLDRNKIMNSKILRLFKMIKFNFVFNKIYSFKVRQLINSQNKIKEIIFKNISDDRSYFKSISKIL